MQNKKRRAAAVFHGGPRCLLKTFLLPQAKKGARSKTVQPSRSPQLVEKQEPSEECGEEK